ncbi:MAG: FimV/HubP family polar landmark protein [Gammaproteobacteria bacterium]
MRKILLLVFFCFTISVFAESTFDCNGDACIDEASTPVTIVSDNTQNEMTELKKQIEILQSNNARLQDIVEQQSEIIERQHAKLEQRPSLQGFVKGERAQRSKESYYDQPLIIASILSALSLLVIILLVARRFAKSSHIHQDLAFCSGENVFDTQLDLAQGFIEMGKRRQAKQLLQHILQHGDEAQKHQAKELLNKLNNS